MHRILGALVLNRYIDLKIELDALEARVLGSLMEKSILIPDQYPLTLRALVAACNQKSSRDPVLSLDQGKVEHTARRLSERHLVTRHENFRSGVQKFEHRLCNTRYSELQFSPAEFAVICLLLLRGPQTPGELRARSGRLHEFADNDAVREVLQGLAQHEDGPFVVRLARSPGRKDSAWAHLFSGEVAGVADSSTPDRESSFDRPAVRVSGSAAPDAGADRVARLEARVERLEQTVDALSRRLADGDSSE